MTYNLFKISSTHLVTIPCKSIYDTIIVYTKFMSLNPYDNRGVSKDQLDQHDNKAKPTCEFSIEWNSLYALVSRRT